MCMIEWADYDPTGFTYADTVTARKAHRCDECGGDINPGDTYNNARGKYDGYFWTCKQCAKCLAVWRWLVDVCGGSLYGGMWEDISEHIDETGDYRLMRIWAIRHSPRWADASPADLAYEVTRSSYRLKAVAA